jgi:acyl-CoA thioester hydrolase
MAKDIDQILRASAVTIEIPIAWGEMDALGHVNNVVFFRYIESARVAFIRALGWKDPRAGSGHLGLGGVGFILQSVQLRFRRPLEYPDTLKVTSRLVSVEADRFTLAHEIISGALGDVAALGEGTVVTYDYAKGEKTEMPAGLRALLEGFGRGR